MPRWGCFGVGGVWRKGAYAVGVFGCLPCVWRLFLVVRTRSWFGDLVAYVAGVSGARCVRVLVLH